jgi:hypothetical protein
MQESGSSIPIINITKNSNIEISNDKTGLSLLLKNKNKRNLMLSDFMSLTYKNAYLNSYSRKYQLLFLIKKYIYKILEFSVYRYLNKIIVQTQVELEYGKSIGLNNLIVIPNLYEENEKYDKLTFNHYPKLGCIADFKTVYLNEIHWLYSQFKFNESNKEILVAGPNSNRLKKYINIIDLGYVNNKSDFFNKIDISICISFKNFGLVNKILEGIKYRKIILTNLEALNGLEYIMPAPFIIWYNESLSYDELVKSYETIIKTISIDDFKYYELLMIKHIGKKVYKNNLNKLDD